MAFFIFNDTATTEIYTLSLHDALPISMIQRRLRVGYNRAARMVEQMERDGDRKSTRLNSSHVEISYAVFCLKKKTKPSCRLNRCVSSNACQITFTTHPRPAISPLT